MSEQTMKDLAHKIDLLIRRCETLESREQQWQQERARLIEKNDIAKTRVEAMIGHLKSLQQGVS